MSGSFVEQLAQFDMRRGKDPIDPTRIEGFGVGSAPAPAPPSQATPEIPSAASLYGEPLELAAPIAQPAPPPSPLVELGGFAKPGRAISVEPAKEERELWVGGASASYRDWPVALNEQEQGAIKKVILKALKRSLEEQYLKVAGTLPRTRGRSAATAAGSATGSPTAGRRSRRSRSAPGSSS